MPANDFGAARVLANLEKVNREIQAGALRGTHKAGLFLQRKAMPRTPIKTGDLRASFDVTSAVVGNKAVTAVANTQSYAPFVHENLEAHHNKGEAKFLERPANEHEQDIRRIIAEAAKVK